MFMEFYNSLFKCHLSDDYLNLFDKSSFRRLDYKSLKSVLIVPHIDYFGKFRLPNLYSYGYGNSINLKQC